jgi:hypothetical protein
MNKRGKTSGEWGKKIELERERLRAYARRYAEEGLEWNILIIEADIESCSRAISNAKKQYELAVLRESQEKMWGE